MTLYEILQIDKKATNKQIKRAYLDRCKEYHPDNGGDEALYKQVQEAYNILKDPQKREAYDNGADVQKLQGNAPSISERLVAVFEKVLNDFGFVPEHSDLVSKMEGVVNEKVNYLRGFKEDGENNIRNLKEIKKRIKNSPTLSTYLENRIDQIVQQLKDADRRIGEEEYLVEVIRKLEYEWSPETEKGENYEW